MDKPFPLALAALPPDQPRRRNNRRCYAALREEVLDLPGYFPGAHVEPSHPDRIGNGNHLRRPALRREDTRGGRAVFVARLLPAPLLHAALGIPCGKKALW